MVPETYEFVPYRGEFEDQVVELQKHHWGPDLDANRAQFRWKYLLNPYTRSPYAVVALYQGQAVGFRGHFVLRYQVGETDQRITILSPSDTCVHPDHRRMGLSVAMNRSAMKWYAEACSLFLNTTCTHASLPGYQRMGYVPLTAKFFVTRHNLRGLGRHVMTINRAEPLSASRIGTGRMGDMLVSTEPRPQEMARLAALERSGTGKLSLVQDEAFFGWRFGNPGKKYAFYYLIDGDVVTGYVVVGVSPNNRRGYLLDYSTAAATSLRQLLQRIVRAGHFDVLSVYGFAVDDKLMAILTELGFREKSLMRSLEHRRDGELPLFLRPVVQEYHDDDFFVGEIDLRRFESWSLKPSCSDAV